MPLIPLACPFCGANAQIDSDKDIAKCPYCGREFVVRDAIVNNYISNVTNIRADTVNVYSQKDFVIEAGVLKKYQGEGVDVAIPDNVFEIAPGVFRNLPIISVKIPATVRLIGKSAFKHCDSLQTIYISDIKSWCETEFADKWANPLYYGYSFILEGKQVIDLEIPEGVESIADFAFFGCPSLANVSFPSTLKRIGYAAFFGCTSLRRVDFPDDVFVDVDAFCSCSSLTEMPEMPDDMIKNICFGTPVYNRVLVRQWKANNRCQYCGGHFVGVINKKCANCEMPKDY